MNILGIDCANKSFGVCVVKHDKEWRKKHTRIYKKFMSSSKDIDAFIGVFKEFNELYDTVYDIKYLKVFDLIPGKKLKDSSRFERTSGLKKVLKDTCVLHPKIDLTLIEYQMSSNDKSRAVFSNTYYHFVDKCDTFKVGPSCKNMIAFNKKLRHSHFTEKYTAYTANKNHSKENLKYWLKLFNKEKLLSGIQKKNYDDAADSFLTILGKMLG